MHADGTTTVLYIGGDSRSGSTALSAILGSYDGVVSVGELRTLWQALKTDQLCGCGEPISQCQFWIAVGECAYGGWASLDVDAMIDADWMVARHRSMARHLLRSTWRADSDLEAHRERLGRLYAAIRETSGARIVVDSTKDPSYAYVLRGVRGIDLRVVHLVRDSRGVAYSNTKTRIIRPEVVRSTNAEPMYMPTWSPMRSAVTWDVKNALLNLVIRAPERRLVKYESLVARPGEELEAIRHFAGGQWGGDGSWDDDNRSFEFLPHHTLGGNPVRYQGGRVRLEPDQEWRVRMGRGDKAVVTAITFPLLVAYGYRVIGSALGSEDSRTTSE